MEPEVEEALVRQMGKTGWKYVIEEDTITFTKYVSEEEEWVYVFVKETGKFMYFNRKEKRKEL